MGVRVGQTLPGFWIPACAGMTVGAAAALRRSVRCWLAGVWIPAFAGMTVGMDAAGMMVRGRECRAARNHRRNGNHALGGYAVQKPPSAEGGLRGFAPTHPTTNRPDYPTVIPAQAGIQKPGNRRPNQRPRISAGCGFPLSRE